MLTPVLYSIKRWIAYNEDLTNDAQGVVRVGFR